MKAAKICVSIIGVELLKNPDVTKLLLAGSEDLEVFIHDFQTLPTPMIDTQILAAFTGRPLSCGFAAMVNLRLMTGNVI